MQLSLKQRDSVLSRALHLGPHCNHYTATESRACHNWLFQSQWFSGCAAYVPPQARHASDFLQQTCRVVGCLHVVVPSFLSACNCAGGGAAMAGGTGLPQPHNSEATQRHQQPPTRVLAVQPQQHQPQQPREQEDPRQHIPQTQQTQQQSQPLQAVNDIVHGLPQQHGGRAPAQQRQLLHARQEHGVLQQQMHSAQQAQVLGGPSRQLGPSVHTAPPEHMSSHQQQTMASAAVDRLAVMRGIDLSSTDVEHLRSALRRCLQDMVQAGQALGLAGEVGLAAPSSRSTLKITRVRGPTLLPAESPANGLAEVYRLQHGGTFYFLGSELDYLFTGVYNDDYNKVWQAT